MILKLLFLAAVLAACAPMARGPDPRPTLLIVNNGIENLRVLDKFGITLARVVSGDHACVTLTRDGYQQLFFVQGAALEPGPLFNPFSHSGWKVEIFNTLVYDVLRLRPAERCT